MHVTQQEFDEIPGIIVHLTEGNPPRASCSGEIIDPNRWADHHHTTRKQCQACFHAARRKMQDDYDRDRT